jgi:hypothetical protein
VTPLGNKNVRGFDVAVNDALSMSGIQSISDLNAKA